MAPQAAKAAKRAPERRQRRYPRYRVEFPVRLTLLSSAGRQSLDAHSKDLSVAGIGVLIAEELNLGEVVALAFAPPGSSEPWELRAVLRHRRGYHYGFEFLSLSGQQGDVLRKYLPGLERAD
ncbi:MAG TPA: PilZ domain-containing protein [Candidatus Sulfotelmatobacter sp.]|nr:PilZ domain-containing protein [Candidatus Sulfotelmatobacter sp.]